MIQAIIENMGHEVGAIASSGETALSLADAEPPDPSRAVDGIIKPCSG